MEVITDICKYNAVPCAAAVGSFDGVHRGHRAMLEELRARACEKGLPTMVVTFVTHPRVFFAGDGMPFLLSSNEEKVALLEAAGVDFCVMLDFDARMASMTAERFMEEVLVEALGVEMLCVGYDHRFGRPQEGVGFEQYVEYGKALGIDVFKALPFVADGVAVSSSKVRRALEEGDISLANAMLGRNYSFSGSVVHGAAVGRGLGFPTANIQLHDGMKMLPADGVYDVRVLCRDGVRKGVMNIGVKPTVGNGLGRTAEVHVLGFSGDMYGWDVVVEPLRRLRGEMKFENMELLRRQIAADVERVERGV